MGAYSYFDFEIYFLEKYRGTYFIVRDPRYECAIFYIGDEFERLEGWIKDFYGNETFFYKRHRCRLFEEFFGKNDKLLEHFSSHRSLGNN